MLAAAKRVTKKRAAGGDAPPSPSAKRSKTAASSSSPSSADPEAHLALPRASAPLSALASTRLQTNRAPLVLAFAVALLRHTHPAQPLSSRLSLAQAVVSANARSKAASVGLAAGPSAEAEGWGRGQPRVAVMGREIPVLRRDPAGTDGGEGPGEAEWKPAAEGPLWGLDTEALRAANTATAGGGIGGGGGGGGHLPIHTPQAARAYLLKSFASAPPPIAPSAPTAESGSPSKTKKPTAAALSAERERNAGLLLQALELLFGSWAGALSRAELDRRAWDWYVAVRPEVEAGAKGWGARGEVDLGAILELRKGGGGGEEGA